MVDEETMLDVLPGIDEVETVLLEFTAGACEAGVLLEPDHGATERCLDGADPGFASDLEADLTAVDGIGIPVVDVHEVHLGSVTDPNVVLRGVGSAALVVEHDGGAGISSDLQHEDLCRLCAVPGPDMDVGLVKFSVCGNTHECQLRTAGHRQGRDTVHRRFDSEVPQCAHGHDGELHASRGFPLPVESGKHVALGQQPGKTFQRGEAPDLLHTCRLRMIGDVP